MTNKIMLIHDDPVFCDNLRQVLASQGFDVVQVRSKESLIETFNKAEPEAVLLRSSLAKEDLEALLSKIGELQESAGHTVEPPDEPKPKITAAKLKEFQDMFHMVKAKYARALPFKVEEIRRDMKAAVDSEFDLDALETVRNMAHKLVGTAGSYGYEEFSDLMRVIEQTAIDAKTATHEERVASWEVAMQAWQGAMVQADRIAASQVEPAAPTQAPARGPVFARVLLIDEDESFLDMVEELGRQINVIVLKASSEGAGMNLALMHTLDAAIINLHADTQDMAFHVATQLRSLPGYETLPLAFVSADPEKRSDAEAAHVGASLHLDKTLDASSLEAAVRHLVAIRQGGRPKVMVVDDDPDFTDRIALDLRNDNLLVRTVNDPTKLLDALSEFPPDVLLLDVMMPNMNGFQVCQMLRGMPRWRDLPIVFITAEINIEARVKAFTSGGDDYLPKPVVTEELLARVRVRLEKSRLLKERSDKDTITGLLLRRAFVEQFNSMLADAERTDTLLSICLMDVDHFKKVNDTYGHMAGDLVLSGFGQLLGRRFRVDDLRGRWGGEEFILAFKRENKDTMRKAINRVQDEFSSITFESDDSRQFSVSFSGGIASYPEDGKTLYDLLTAADARLYEAKHAGRKRIFISNSG